MVNTKASDVMGPMPDWVFNSCAILSSWEASAQKSCGNVEAAYPASVPKEEQSAASVQQSPRRFSKSAPYSQRQYSLLPLFASTKCRAKSQHEKTLSTKFPGIAATFPEHEAKFADFGQKTRKSGLRKKLFAVKFAHAGNWQTGLGGLFLICLESLLAQWNVWGIAGHHWYTASMEGTLLLPWTTLILSTISTFFDAQSLDC